MGEPRDEDADDRDQRGRSGSRAGTSSCGRCRAVRNAQPAAAATHDRDEQRHEDTDQERQPSTGSAPNSRVEQPAQQRPDHAHSTSEDCRPGVPARGRGGRAAALLVRRRAGTGASDPLDALVVLLVGAVEDLGREHDEQPEQPRPAAESWGSRSRRCRAASDGVVSAPGTDERRPSSTASALAAAVVARAAG